MAQIFAIVNFKGGVGKTTTTLNLGAALARVGRRVLLVDADAQANLTLWANVAPKLTIYDSLVSEYDLPVLKVVEGLYVVPADIRLSQFNNRELDAQTDLFRFRKLLAPLAKDYDYILIDCPPALDMFSKNAVLAATDVLITLEAHFLSTSGLYTILEFVAKLRKLYNHQHESNRILITKKNNTVISRNLSDQVRGFYGPSVFRTEVRATVSVVEASAMRQDIFTYSPGSAAAKDYAAVASEIMYEAVSVA